MQRRVSASLVALWLVCMATLPTGAQMRTRSLGLDPCTVVAVEMLGSVDSKTAQPGDFFRFQTINAVTVRTHIAIPARTMGYGIVVIASPAARAGRPGTLLLEPRYLVLPNGRKLGVVLDHSASGLYRSGPTGDAPGYLGVIPLPALDAAVNIFNLFHNGKNIDIPRGTVFAIFPSDDPSVERCQAHPAY
ncbi:MAG: hypothetical protein ACYDA5_11485 [Vulcanimicrobiaceae bacterium]